VIENHSCIFCIHEIPGDYLAFLILTKHFNILCIYLFPVEVSEATNISA